MIYGMYSNLQYKHRNWKPRTRRPHSYRPQYYPRTLITETFTRFRFTNIDTERRWQLGYLVGKSRYRIVMFSARLSHSISVIKLPSERSNTLSQAPILMTGGCRCRPLVSVNSSGLILLYKNAPNLIQNIIHLQEFIPARKLWTFTCCFGDLFCVVYIKVSCGWIIQGFYLLSGHKLDVVMIV